ncbi:tRNA (guanosine(46)-N7)-methyltransferase TrmB [Rarobacter faecitabidus]|uniref:tRNA (guanine-N(7)-)-methyltransferase n=1 Tax=Rarobacter faecitabidus TaxID=13243 RepID=A0A542ZWR7_RARFA|nr:tRNA (guanosine(46)-N7)-methyltransferase TrmB [Rarobacter faecitabidus]TQL64782.1 tRNA (guanine-N7-)-methyltransferase [Rarobacter faecitabidus]
MTSSTDPAERPHRRIRSYVQRSSRLGPRLQGHWDRFAPTYLVPIEHEEASMSIASGAALDPSALFGRVAPLVLEIGSGRGEMIAHGAEQRPERDHLACEVYTPGVAGILGRVGRAELTNVRLVHADATALLEYVLPAGSLDELWVFFPDPWHKSRHHKRRLINDEFASLAARVLKPGGIWRIATDWPDYADQVDRVLTASQDFDGGRTDRFDLRPLTRFEQKAHAEGRGVADFAAVRR